LCENKLKLLSRFLFQQTVKPARDDKNKGLRRGAEAPHYPDDESNRVFQQPVKSVRDDKHKGLEGSAEAPNYPNEHFLRIVPHPATVSPSKLAKSERRIAKSGHLRFGESYAG